MTTYAAVAAELAPAERSRVERFGGTAASGVGLCLWLTACGAAGLDQPIVPVPSGGTIADACPAGELAIRGAGAPTFLKVANGTLETVRFSLDRCIGHRLIAAIESEDSVKVLLPKELVLYPEGLRINAYVLPGGTRLGTFAVESVVADTAVFRLTRQSEALPQGGGVGGVDYSRFGRTEAAELGDTPRVSTFAVNTPGVLSWQCLEAGPVLVLSTGGKISGDVTTVVLSRGARIIRAADGLEVVTGITDSVLLPTDWGELIPRIFADVPVVALDVPDDARITVPHQFHGGGLRGELSNLPCFQEGI